MNPAAIDSKCSPACARAREIFLQWWHRAACVGLLAAISAQLGIDLYRTMALNRTLEVIRQAGGIHARDDEARGRPVVSIDLDSYLVDDSGQVHRRGRASDQLLAVIPRFNELRELSLAGANVTDAGLLHLTKLKALRRLSLRGTQVSDAGVSQLTRCDLLRWIDLRETCVTSAGVGLLQSALPGADILTDTE
jgi:hypothetical protein